MKKSTIIFFLSLFACGGEIYATRHQETDQNSGDSFGENETKANIDLESDQNNSFGDSYGVDSSFGDMDFLQDGSTDSDVDSGADNGVGGGSDVLSDVDFGDSNISDSDYGDQDVVSGDFDLPPTDEDFQSSCYVLCHIPPGNYSNKHTICVGSINAADAHYAHGDYPGECEENSCHDDDGDGEDDSKSRHRHNRH